VSFIFAASIGHTSEILLSLFLMAPPLLTTLVKAEVSR
jgi:hypothetical protein